jgi:predicted Zn-dependent protease
MNRFLGLLICVVALVGCFSSGEKTAMVSSDPFGNSGPVEPVRKASFAPAPSEMSARVDQIGSKVLAANPQTGLRPVLFATIGSPSPELFHGEQHGIKVVYITQGLVQQCKTEAELAALLSKELGKMVSEREARTRTETRDPDRLAPIDVPIGQAGMSSITSGSDLTHMAEVARFENSHPRRRGPLPAPDPMVLARMYLEKAGYRPADLEAVRPLLDAAEKNAALEKTLGGKPRQGNWMP